MSEKIEILEELGESALLLPSQIERALAANDRIKYFMTLMQTAARHTETPHQHAPDLSMERVAAGIADTTLDRLPELSERGEGEYRIPRASWLYQQMRDCLHEMLVPIQTSASAEFDVALFEARLSEVAAESAIVEDHVPALWLSTSTSADRSAGDSLHLLVMDLHRALNRLQTAIAPETIDGAAVYNVEDIDLPRIRAFMSGLNRTAPLKFNHPGLATTATRSGSALLLQNDIGTTDAHVLVVRVEHMTVTVTYTDVHPERAEFFRSLFKAFDVSWSSNDERTPGWKSEDPSYVLLTGVVTAAREEDLDRVLAFLGSRLVFLIDWNRARRGLRKFVRNRVAIEVLRWAATEDLGHRAWVQLGDAGMMANAIDQASPEPLPYGKRLDELLGEDATADCLRMVLRIASTGLSAGNSERLIRDEVRSELARRFRSFEERLLEISAEHLLLVSDLTAAAQHSITQVFSDRDDAVVLRLAARAAEWEVQADVLAAAARIAESQTETHFYGPLLKRQDDIADALEDVVFLCTLLRTAGVSGAVETSLRSQADLLVRGSRAMVRCVSSALAVKRDSADDDTHDFLQAVDEVVTIEHEGDTACREFERALVDGTQDYGQQQHLMDRMSSAMESSLDAMSHTALMLRDHLIAPGWTHR